MLNVKPNITSLITGIYECQKKILINRRLVRELEMDGNHDHLKKYLEEINKLEKKIKELQKDLKEKYLKNEP